MATGHHQLQPRLPNAGAYPQHLLHMLTVFQVNGHYVAKLDPLGIDQRPMPVELDLALYGFSDKDMDRE